MQFFKTSNQSLKRIDNAAFKGSDKTPIIIILDNIRSHHNVGSVFRTADAFLVEAIYLCGYTPQPPHRDIQKTALGATDSVEWKYFQTTSEAIHHAKQNGFFIAAIEQAEPKTELQNFYPSSKTALIFGSEVGGVDDEIINLADACIEIPQFGTKHSLNISVCAGIVLWDLFLKIKFEK
jgi:23S rRNA (guanosine2251-2'-O)-methyltransferase